MLKIANLKATVDGKEILKGLNIEVKPGEVHAIMGPNGRVRYPMYSPVVKIMKPPMEPSCLKAKIY